MLSFLTFFLLNLEAKSIDFDYPHQSLYLDYYPQTNHIY